MTLHKGASAVLWQNAGSWNHPVLDCAKSDLPTGHLLAETLHWESKESQA